MVERVRLNALNHAKVGKCYSRARLQDKTWVQGGNPCNLSAVGNRLTTINHHRSSPGNGCPARTMHDCRSACGHR